MRNAWAALGSRAGRVQALAAAGLLTLAAPLHAQAVPFSQRAAVTQTLGTTTITVRYGRPNARGRTLFGRLVPWGRPWNPGADSATTVMLDRAVRVEGEVLPAGTYSLWVIPDSAGPWTVIFSRAALVYHTPYPGTEHDALRVRSTPRVASHMESLAILFPDVRATDGVLALHWGTTVVDLRLEVVPE